MQHMPELQAIGSGAAAGTSCPATTAPHLIQQAADVSAFSSLGLKEDQKVISSEGASQDESEDIESKSKASGSQVE
jgi:hypothetical protein